MQNLELGRFRVQMSFCSVSAAVWGMSLHPLEYQFGFLDSKMRITDNVFHYA